MESHNDNSDLIDSILDEALLRVRNGGVFEIDEYCRRYPALADELRVMLPALSMLEKPFSDSSRPQNDNFPSELPRRIGRYRIEGVLGKGGFGLVYLARDEQLNRAVAVKVPHARLIAKPEDAEAYLTEAQTVANLDHPNIVPVHDVGSTNDFPCFIVSKYIQGTSLATRIKQRRFKYRDAAELVAEVAAALHYAHKQGLVHRDVKPSNILIGSDDKPYVVDFGLALRDENLGTGLKFAGTPAYMSPEQVRGEGHRVDGRSDIFSLGVVLFELLAGRQPFRGDSLAELLEQVTSHEARPLRQYDEKLPKELDRICQKAMAKRASDRYSTAYDLSEDLRQFLREQTLIQSSTSPSGIANVALETNTSFGTPTSVGSSAAAPDSFGLGSSGSQQTKIVPKGLRSFDAHDADFFLELLPGPRDRNGLPDSIRFWKTHIESTDPDGTFIAGLIYGPSGCGKSSLVKAGLLPRLSSDVTTVYLEATPEETELRLLSGLRKRCPLLEEQWSLTESLAALRRGQAFPTGKKILIVIDQFEQWMHAKRDQENTELVAALRQCDGVHIQCMVMVRDDFWMAATRFMRNLEVSLVEGHNSAAVDLFPIRHAERVLAAFGRAFGALPAETKALTKEQTTFLTEAVTGLAELGKVVCVRLALFAEMFKGKPWTPATLREVGGTTGVGFTFLEETFAATTAPPEHRYHQVAARAVLKDLLPDSGTDIKGHMRSRGQLLAASGYANHSRDFDELLRILDSELRLITPTDPEGIGTGEQRSENFFQGSNYSTSNLSTSNSDPLPCSTLYYQLTHDYLVPSICDWLTRKQRETKQGRAELKLVERVGIWNSKRENKQLPTLLEWLNIRRWTKARNWNQPQRQMMLVAQKTHLTRLAVALTCLLLILIVGYEINGRIKARGLVTALAAADADGLPPVLNQLDRYSRWANPALRKMADGPADDATAKRLRMNAQMQLVNDEPAFVRKLVDQLFECDYTYIGVICDRLRPYKADVVPLLAARLVAPGKEGPSSAMNSQSDGSAADTGPSRTATDDGNNVSDSNYDRFRAGLALALIDPESKHFTTKTITFLAEQLVTANVDHQLRLRDYLRGVKRHLLSDLERIFGDEQASENRLLTTTNALADFALDDPSRLARLLTIANPAQYETIFPLYLETRNDTALKELESLVADQPGKAWAEPQRISLGKRRAGAAITLLKTGDQLTPLEALKITDDPESITQFVARCRARDVSVDNLFALLDTVDDFRKKQTGEARLQSNRMIYGLLLTLGSYPLDALKPGERETRLAQLVDWYAQDPCSGIHGATGWLLRQWGQTPAVHKIDETPIPYSPQREWFVQRFEPIETAEGKKLDDTQAFCLTFIVFQPGTFRIGSPEEFHRHRVENLATVTLTRPLAVSDREITWRAYSFFDGDSGRRSWEGQFGRPITLGDPVFGVNWYKTVAFSRWLTAQSGLGEEAQCYADPTTIEKDGDGNPLNWPLRLERSGFRLPTEAEWEYVCRSGMSTPYSFGSDPSRLGDYGWYEKNSDLWSKPAAQLRPNPRGLFDIHGNLFEWCHDWYGKERKDNENDPVGLEVSTIRVSRGGSWDLSAEFCRSAFRYTDVPSGLQSDFGFRLALNPSVETPETDSARPVQPSGTDTK